MQDDERTRASRVDSIDSGASDATHADGTGEQVLAEELLPGAALGRYAVLGQLGAGAMGVVYAAYDGQLERKVAIKVVKLDRRDKGSSGSGVPRLLREAQALARLSHPNVVPIFDVGSEGDRMFLAMELVEGETLREWLERKPRRWREIVELMIGAGRGLAAAHAAQIVHRDFKPDNVLVAAEGPTARVTDFGLARGLQDEAEPISNPIDSHDSLSRTLTRTGSVMGTPSYMAPEQHFGRPAEPRSDEYAFCVTLFEALYGMRPFSGGAIEAVARLKWTNTIADPGSARPSGMPEELHRVIVRGLDRDPERRFASMNDLLAELERLLQRRSRAPWIAAGAVVFVIGATWAWSMRPSGCADAREQLAGVWDSQRTAEVEAAFASAGTRASDTMWPRVRARLDEHATRWTEVHEQLCRAGRGAEGTATGLDAGMACLRANKGELAGVVDVLAAADRGTVHASLELLDSLDDLDTCADPDATPAAPQDPAHLVIADEVAATRARVDGVQYPQAIAIGEQALADAHEHGDTALACEVEIQLGIAKARSGRYDEAERHYTTTFWSAREHGLDDRALEAATRMVFLLAAEVEDLPRATEWLRHAEAQLARTQVYETRAHAMLLQNAAQVHEELGDYTEAEHDLRHALEIRRQTEAEDSRSSSMLRNNLGTMLTARGRLEEALAMHTIARANRVSRLGPMHPDVAMSDINIANVLTRLGRFHEALEHIEDAHTVVAETLGENTPTMATLRSIRGAAWLNIGRNDLAHLDFQAVLSSRILRLGPDHPSVGTAWNLVGAAYDRPEDGEIGLRYFQRALAIFESNGEAGALEAAQTRMNIGVVLLRDGKLALAEPLMRTAFAEIERRREPNHPDLSQGLLGLARLEIELGHPELALSMLDRARAIERALGMGQIERTASKYQRARAIWAIGRDPAAAIALAREARVHAAADADVPTAELATIDEWLAAHPEPVVK